MEGRRVTLEEAEAVTIAHLLDHVMNVWRRSEDLDEFRATEQSHAKVHEDVDCTFQRRNTVMAEDPPGVRARGDRRVYLDVGPEFRDRDVLEVVSGPAGFVGPQLLEVESIAVPRGHHVELRCTEFKGTLPAEGS